MSVRDRKTDGVFPLTPNLSPASGEGKRLQGKHTSSSLLSPCGRGVGSEGGV